MGPDACLSEDDVLAFVQGGLSPERLAAVDGHLAACDDCVRLVAAIAKESADDDAPEPLDEVDGPSPLGPGALVGRYRIQCVLGEGAMGRVYAALDPELDRVVALKLLHPRVASGELERRLQREAKAMARITHSEVVTVYDAGRHGAQLFLAMELVDGGTLRDWLARARRPWREVLAIFLRAGRGLAVAHEAGLIHRDFKPDNVLVGRDGRVRVTDFGLARATDAVEPKPASLAETPPRDDALTRTGALLGTPAYMAPEQLRGEPADVRSDVYAFSVALYEGLFGERPFRAASLGELAADKRAERVRPEPGGSVVPARLRRAILAGLRADPAARYPSMAVALQRIEGAANAPRARLAAAATIALLSVTAALAWRAASARRPLAAVVIRPSAGVVAPRCSPSACATAHGGAPYVCRPSDGACVAIASEDCVATYEPGDLSADDAVWIGAMFPTKGPMAKAFGTSSAAGVELARKDVASATRALVAGSTRVRPLALVTCDDSTDPPRAARHLVDDLGVPAIVGFGNGQTLVDLAGSLLIPRRVLAIATLSENPLVTRVPQPAELPRMVWRATYSAHDTAAATARILHDALEPRVAPSARPVRVTVGRTDSGSGLWFSEELHRRLVFNGRTAAENGDAYAELALPLERPRPAALGDLATRIAATRASFVVLAGQTVVMAPLAAEIEARWPRGSPKPAYLLSDASTAGLTSFMGADVDRRRRVFAMTSVATEQTVRFVLRYNAAHEEPVTVFSNPASEYDAFFLLAYASFAIGDAAVDGPALARAFSRLVPPGRAVDVGPMPLFEGISALRAGERIDLRGAGASLDFDLATGEAPSDFALICAGVDAKGRASGDVESGVYYRAASRAVEGTLRCP